MLIRYPLYGAVIHRNQIHKSVADGISLSLADSQPQTTDNIQLNKRLKRHFVVKRDTFDNIVVHRPDRDDLAAVKLDKIPRLLVVDKAVRLLVGIYPPFAANDLQLQIKAVVHVKYLFVDKDTVVCIVQIRQYHLLVCVCAKHHDYHTANPNYIVFKS